MANRRRKLGILLVPAYGRAEFDHLPIPYFWLPSFTINKQKIEVIALNVENKDVIYNILSHEVDCLLMTGKSAIVEAKLEIFNYCLNAITNKETTSADKAMVQHLEKYGIYTNPKETFFIPTKCRKA